MRRAFLLLAALALPALAATSQTATVTRTAELRATPTLDGALVTSLPADAKVDVLKRVGGWYRVKAGDSEGWVRMWLLRLSAPAGGVAVLSSGRSTSTYTTATTGVRGLSEEELKNAKPN